MRRLAVIKKIDDIRAIPDADNIELAIIGGWQAVIKKYDHKVGDLVIYCEVDSWIPTELAPFLSKGNKPKEYMNIKGERLRTIKLRGQLSQGLLLPLSLLGDDRDKTIDNDVTDILRIVKYEKPISVQLMGVAKGNLPSSIPKTDQERCQNLAHQINALCLTHAHERFEVTEKLEGTSMTCYMIDGVFGVCSRNLDLLRDENNSLWKTAIADDLEGKMRECGWDNMAIQGELVGEGIQSNIYNLKGVHFYVFDIYNIEIKTYISPIARRRLCNHMGFQQVPILYDSIPLSPVKHLLEMADGKSELGTRPMREGIVFRQTDGKMRFKVISNSYLCSSS
jgi:RNA ligase (TIGR02306 family)